MKPCPYCLSENSADTLVCVVCSRDIAIPVTLIAERDDLVGKLEILREQLRSAQQEIAMIKNRRKSR